MLIGKRLGAIGAIAAGVLALAASPALAGPGLHITVHNETTPAKGVAVALQATGEKDCWYDEDLGKSNDANAVRPGQARTFYTEREVYIFNSCGRSDAHRGLVLKTKVGSGPWETPSGEPDKTHLYFQNIPYLSNDLDNFGFQIRDSLTTWLPLPDNRGLICWRAAMSTSPDGPNEYNFTATGFADVWVYDDGRCNTPGPAKVANGTWNPVGPKGPTYKRATAAQAEEPGGDPARIADVLSTVGVLCPWWAFPKNQERCYALNPGDEAQWTLRNITSEVRGFQVLGSPRVLQQRESIGSATQTIPPGGGGGTLSVSKTVTTQNTTSTQTQHGGKAGLKLGFKQSGKVGLPGLAESGVEFSQEITGEYNYSKSATETRQDSESRQVAVSYQAQPGYTSTLDVFLVKRTADFNYKADLDIGADGRAEAVVTPGNAALDQSPSTRQPCLAYMVGDAHIRNSIMNSGQQLLNAGYSPDEPTLSDERSLFLRSLPFWRSSGKPCPGFPNGFDSVAGFNGTGIGKYMNLGYDAQGNPTNQVVGCVYRAPVTDASGGPATSPGQGANPGGSPCQDYTTTKADGKLVARMAQNGASTPGVLDDASADPAGTVVMGGATSDKIIGPDAGGTIDAGGGAFDIVQAGAGDTVIEGGDGANLLRGGAGNDTISGGPGHDQIEGGAGNDQISDTGSGDILAGPGDDVIRGDSLTGVIDGGAGNDTVLLTGDASHTQVRDPSGDTTIDLIGTGTPTITIAPTASITTLRTDHSLRADLYVDHLVATGDAPVDLTATEGTSLITGNAAGNVLRAGIGATTLDGGAGDDDIRMGADNDDTATGGPGADLFRSAGIPQRWPRSVTPRVRSANTITDFSPAEGDRIVLSRGVYGRAVAGLVHRFQAVSGPDPRPLRKGATLLFNTRTHVLSFDADGRGPIADKVVARLPGQKRATSAWISVRR
jgi:Ca2+-binding RTX toxin-like protein